MIHECPECGGEKGVHLRGCALLEESWESLLAQMPERKPLEAALKERGYVTLFAIGCGVRPDGTSIKIAARPSVRNLAQLAQWPLIRQTIIDAMDDMMTRPMDDLEFGQ